MKLAEIDFTAIVLFCFGVFLVVITLLPYGEGEPQSTSPDRTEQGHMTVGYLKRLIEDLDDSDPVIYGPLRPCEPIDAYITADGVMLVRPSELPRGISDAPAVFGGSNMPLPEGMYFDLTPEVWVPEAEPLEEITSETI